MVASVVSGHTFRRFSFNYRGFEWRKAKFQQHIGVWKSMVGANTGGMWIRFYQVTVTYHGMD